jgi:ABC-2 type transport system permease protein
MRGFWPLFKRELFGFFVTPLAWVLIIVFLLVQGMHFFLMVDAFASQSEIVSDQSPLSAFFGNTVLLYVVLFLLVPPLTMRLFAEERRSGTLETLLTVPISSTTVVLAKYAAAVVTYAAMWLPTTYYLVILSRTGTIDVRVAAASYAGVLLVGAAFLAIGLWMSALTRSQFLSLVLTALIILVLFIVGVAEFVTKDGTWMHAVAGHVSIWAQMNEMSSGIVDSRRLVFDLALIVVPLLMTVRATDAMRGAA